MFTALHAERLVFQSGGKTLVRVTCKDADGDSEASQIQEFIPQWVSEIVAEVRAHAHFRELHHIRPAHMFATSHVCHQRLTSVLCCAIFQRHVPKFQKIPFFIVPHENSTIKTCKK